MRISYIIIPLITIAVSLIGSSFTSGGIEGGWYESISKPSWTPPGSVIGTVWTIIFILTTISALILWKNAPRDTRFYILISVFLANAFLNVFWSYLFFSQHLIGYAVFEAALLGLSVIVLIVLAWPISRLAAYLLVPYAAWVSFAIYLTYSVWKLNS
jgi:tryptophan-rich sensory protein